MWLRALTQLKTNATSTRIVVGTHAGLIAVVYVILAMLFDTPLNQRFNQVLPLEDMLPAFLLMTVTALVGVIGVFLAYLHSLMRRRRVPTFALYRALGLTKGRLLGQLTLENALIEGQALALGLVMGVLGSKLVVMILARFLGVLLDTGLLWVPDAASATIGIFVTIAAGLSLTDYPLVVVPALGNLEVSAAAQPLGWLTHRGVASGLLLASLALGLFGWSLGDWLRWAAAVTGIVGLNCWGLAAAVPALLAKLTDRYPAGNLFLSLRLSAVMVRNHWHSLLAATGLLSLTMLGLMVSGHLMGVASLPSTVGTNSGLVTLTQFLRFGTGVVALCLMAMVVAVLVLKQLIDHQVTAGTMTQLTMLGMTQADWFQVQRRQVSLWLALPVALTAFNSGLAALALGLRDVWGFWLLSLVLSGCVVHFLANWTTQKVMRLND